MKNSRINWNLWNNRDPVEQYSNFMADDVCKFFRRDFQVGMKFYFITYVSLRNMLWDQIKFADLAF